MALVAWHGISVRVPADWSLVGVNGDANKGYFRVDSPVASALEIRWSSAPSGKPELMAKGREFLANLAKSCRKNKIKFDRKIKPDADDPNTVEFSWRADRIGQGFLHYCSECGRVLIAQMVMDRDEKITHLVARVLGSVRDHRDDGWVDWGLYGLSFAVPKGYKLEKQNLMSGYLSLSFKHRGRTLVVERWALASTLLASDRISQWYRKDAAPDIKGYKIELREADVHEHSGLIVEGKRAGMRQAIRAALASLTLNPHPGEMTGYAWHCAQSNRLFAVRATHAQGEDIAAGVRDTVRCHKR